MCPYSGADPEILKGVALYVGHHGWPKKNILGFRWSKKAKIMFKTITFCQNNTMKACQQNLTNFSKFANALIRKGEKTLMQQSMRKEKSRKVGLCFITGCFIKSFNKIINHFFVSQAHSQPKFCFLISG